MSVQPELSLEKRLLLEKHLSGAGVAARRDAIVPRAPGEAVPISAEQKNVWLHAAMAPDVSLYNEALTIHRLGSFDRTALEKSFAEILHRHEIWRTGFESAGGELRQIVHPDLRIDIPLIDLSDCPDAERERAAAALATEDARLPFDLARPPLLRATIVRFAPDNHRLYVTLHHIIFDGVSIYRVIVPELAALYESYAKGREPEKAPCRLQYGDYALWRARQLAHNQLDREIDYWRRQLAGELPILQLPADRPRPNRPTHRGGMETFQLSTELTEALKRLSRSEGATLYAVLLAAFKAMLHRYSGQEDIVIGGVTDMRRRPELDRVVGYFLNSLPLRTRPAGAMPFRDYLRQVQETVIAALDASTVPFDRIVREIQPKREGATHPIFQILFSVEPPPPVIPDGWDLTQMDVTVGVAKFDLYLELDERPEGLIGRFLYSTDLFDAQTIQRMIGHWTNVLAGIVADPASPLARLPLLSPEESRQLLGDVNATRRVYPERTAVSWFDDQAKKTPDAIAIVCRGKTWRYRDLRERTNVLASRLERTGIARGALVGIMMERSPDMVAALLAVNKSGAAYLPLDPNLPEKRLAALVEDSKPAAVLTERSLAPRLPPGPAILLCDDLAPGDEFSRVVESRWRPDDLAYVLYTSGSTGKPKAVEIAHRSLANLLAAMQDELQLGPRDRFLAVTTLSFDIAALELFLPLVTGATLVLAGRGEAADPPRLIALLRQSNPTIMQATPATWRALISAGWMGSKSLSILCGGEALQSDLAGALLERSSTLWNVYGPTETTIWSMIHRVRREDDPVPIGRPLANTTIYVLDTNGQPVPAGVTGELHIGGAGVARGYRNDPALTAARFRTIPALSGERLYRTGDIVRFRRDGLVECLGRSDNQVKIRGFRVEVEEVEAAIVAHPGIAAAAVRSFPDASRELSLVAFVVPTAITGEDDLGLTRFLEQRLPAHMIPSRVVPVTSLPTTSNGKIDRAGLQVPQDTRRRERAEPRDALEKMLAELWTKLLAVSTIGRDEDFFELGGHSLLAAMLAAEIGAKAHRNLPLASLFQARTIAAMAELLRSGEEPTFSHLVGLRTKGRGRPLFIVHGIFGNVLQFHSLAEQLKTDRPIYALQARGVDQRHQPHKTIAEMAEAYIDAIRKVQSAGPYTLAGYSFGGLIAYEMACRLREQGEEVDVLALFETDVYYRNLLFAEWLSYQWSLVARVVRKLKILPFREWSPYLMSKLSMILHRLFLRLETAEAEDHSHEVPEGMRARNREMYRICIREFISYRPRRFAGRIAVFHTAEPAFDVCDPLPLWRRMADRVDVFTVAGTHGTVMNRENAGSLAAQLGRCLAGEDSTKCSPPESYSGPSSYSGTILRPRAIGYPMDEAH